MSYFRRKSKLVRFSAEEGNALTKNARFEPGSLVGQAAGALERAPRYQVLDEDPRRPLLRTQSLLFLGEFLAQFACVVCVFVPSGSPKWSTILLFLSLTEKSIVK